MMMSDPDVDEMTMMILMFVLWACDWYQNGTRCMLRGSTASSC